VSEEQTPMPGFIREAQRRAAAASQVGGPADLAARREERERSVWPAESLEAEKKAGAYVARLYPFLGVERGVSTPKGQGTLHSARSSGCQVLLTRQKATAHLGGGKMFRPCVEFMPEEIAPYRGGGR
jgi:hypothetical protein